MAMEAMITGISEALKIFPTIKLEFSIAGAFWCIQVKTMITKLFFGMEGQIPAMNHPISWIRERIIIRWTWVIMVARLVGTL